MEPERVAGINDIQLRAYHGGLIQRTFITVQGASAQETRQDSVNTFFIYEQGDNLDSQLRSFNNNKRKKNYSFLWPFVTFF